MLIFYLILNAIDGDLFSNYKYKSISNKFNFKINMKYLIIIKIYLTTNIGLESP